MNPFPPPPVFTMRQVFENTRDTIYQYLGSNWRLCHLGIAAEGRIIHVHVICVDGTLPDLDAYMPSEITHPAAIASAALMAHRSMFDPVVQGYLSEETTDDSTDEEPASGDMRRFDA